MTEPVSYTISLGNWIFNSFVGNNIAQVPYLLIASTQQTESKEYFKQLKTSIFESFEPEKVQQHHKEFMMFMKDLANKSSKKGFDFKSHIPSIVNAYNNHLHTLFWIQKDPNRNLFFLTDKKYEISTLKDNVSEDHLTEFEPILELEKDIKFLKVMTPSCFDDAPRDKYSKGGFFKYIQEKQLRLTDLSGYFNRKLISKSLRVVDKSYYWLGTQICFNNRDHPITVNAIPNTSLISIEDLTVLHHGFSITSLSGQNHQPKYKEFLVHPLDDFITYSNIRLPMGEISEYLQKIKLNIASMEVPSSPDIRIKCTKMQYKSHGNLAVMLLYTKEYTAKIFFSKAIIHLKSNHSNFLKLAHNLLKT